MTELAVFALIVTAVLSYINLNDKIHRKNIYVFWYGLIIGTLGGLAIHLLCMNLSTLWLSFL